MNLDETELSEVLRAVAVFGLPAHTPAAVLGPFDDESWEQICSRLKNAKLTGLAVASWQEGRLALSEHHGEMLLQRHRAAMSHVVDLERRLIQIAGAFQHKQVDHVVLKGPALARAHYPDESWRAFADVDVLVRTEDWRVACSTLAELGYQRRLPEPWRGFDERFGKAAEFSKDGREVDLHRTLVVGPFGLWIDPQALSQMTESVLIGGLAFRRLNDTATFINVCMHAALGLQEPTLLSLRDVIQVLTTRDLNWPEILDLARKWRLLAVIRYAIASAGEILRVNLPDATRAVTAAAAPASEVRALKAYTTRRPRGGVALSTLRAIPGPRKKIAYGRALLFPDREFLAVRSPRRPSYIKRWGLALSWLRRPPASHED